MAYYGGYTATMTTQPTNQDILTAVSDLSQVVGKIAIDVESLKSDVSTLKSDVSTLKSDVSTLKTQMIEVQDEQERQGKKLDQITGSNSFTGFTSGAAVA